MSAKPAARHGGRTRSSAKAKLGERAPKPAKAKRGGRAQKSAKAKLRKAASVSTKAKPKQRPLKPATRKGTERSATSTKVKLGERPPASPTARTGERGSTAAGAMSGERARAAAPPEPVSGLTAADVMVRDVITVRPDLSVDEVSELFQMNNINGAPVVNSDGTLVGIITEDDIVFGRMGFTDEELDILENEESGEKAAGTEDGFVRPAESRDKREETETADTDTAHKVGEIMTPNPIAIEEDTPVEEICRIMWRLKIHRVPVIRRGKVTGIVSTADICRLVVEGRARLVPKES
jgi:CBS domain-containing protein